MLTLPARSSLAELAQLARRWRCYDTRARHDQPRFRDVIEVNAARARREASLSLGCSELHIRVEPVATALNGLGVA
jgi:hypothetical protein